MEDFVIYLQLFFNFVLISMLGSLCLIGYKIFKYLKDFKPPSFNNLFGLGPMNWAPEADLPPNPMSTLAKSLFAFDSEEVADFTQNDCGGISKRRRNKRTTD